MEAKDGDTVENLLNGKYYTIKRIVKSFAVLESESGETQILTGIENLDLFYEKKERVET
ncbi:MAG TPA: hypothetical protein VMV04_20115 [Thermodesulfobacteriota bacterium]|nr:hypothetical protein [Thermodesulfobacteriota bacterium]